MTAGILDSLKACLATWVELFRTRMEIVSTEFEEEKVRLSEIILFGAVALFLLGFGLILLTFLVVAIFWDGPYRLPVLGAFTFVYLMLGAAAALSAHPYTYF